MRVKIVIEADLSDAETQKHPVIKILKQIRKANELYKNVSVATPYSKPDIIHVQPVMPKDNILTFP